MEFPISKVNLDSQEVTFETGSLAKQANAAVTVQLNGTIVLVAACMKQEMQKDLDFFPLTVDYQEKTYAAGRIPGGFFKREGRPKDIEILTGRVIDRSIRPLFDHNQRNAVQVVCLVLSSDAENDPDILALNGASCALTISDIPFFGPIGAVRVAKTNQGFIINPTYKQREESSLDMILSGNKEKIIMIESKSFKETEETILEAIKFGHKYIKELITAQEDLRKQIGKEKAELEISELNPDLLAKIEGKIKNSLETLYKHNNKKDRHQAVKELLNKLYNDTELRETEPEAIKSVFENIEKEVVRKHILDSKLRPDGRNPEDLRNITCQVNILPRTHGSALFTRGQTQSLAVTTLGTASDEQMIEALKGQSYKNFMLHYSFPPFSVGEVSPLRGPSRREIGHGALAEKALQTVIPSKDDFPYTIRVVSEILESNGSSSMASVCAAALSLMDAGVPIKETIAGVALGLVSEKDNYIILADIAGIEDHFGDMDFKIAGGKEGIAAIQLDLKIRGINYEILKDSFALAKIKRIEILEKMEKALSQPRQKVSEFAPKIKHIKVVPEKIGELIGPGGRTIRKIISQTGVNIDIDDEKGIATISAENEEALQKGIAMVEGIIREPQVGEIYESRVVKITNFGAFCELTPGGKQGLLHISEIANSFVKNVTDYLKEGDTARVIIIGIDEQGKITLSKKQLDKQEAEQPNKS